jgi:hypothetical protein
VTSEPGYRQGRGEGPTGVVRCEVGEPDRLIGLAAARRWALVTGIEGAITLATNDLRLEEDWLYPCTTSRP